MAIVFLIGRIIFGGYFLYNAYSHFKNHVAMTGYSAMKGVPMPKVAVFAGGILLLLGGLAILLGMYMVLGMILLVLFLIPVTFKMHAFWKENDPMMRMAEQIHFSKNIALLGALLMMISIGMMLG